MHVITNLLEIHEAESVLYLCDILCLYNMVLCHRHSDSVASRTSKTDYVLLAEELLSLSLCHFAGFLNIQGIA